MKNLRFKTISFLTLFSFLLIFPLSCSNYTSEDLQTPISCNNFEQYENFEGFVYENVKYNLVHFDPYHFISANDKEAYIAEIESLETQTEGMSIDEMLIYFKNQEKITQSTVDKISYIYNFIDDEFDTGSPDFSVINTELQNLINQEKAQSLIPCITRETNVGLYSSIKGLMNYISEISTLQTFDDNNGQVSTRCGYGIFSCIFSGAISGAIIGATAAGIVGGPVGVGAGIIVGFSIGAIAGFALYVFDGNYGTCDNCEEQDCNPVMGVSLTFPTCTSARYTAFGFGQDVTSTLAWTNIGGTPATTTTTTANPRTTILQNSPSIPVVTTISASCPSGNGTTIIPSNEFTRNISSLALEIFGLTLYGEAHVLPGDTKFYTVHGYNNNANYSTQWFVNNGTILSSTNTSAQIQWDAGFTSGWVQAQVFNNCGNYSKTFTFNVTGDGTDIP